jgi:UDP-N-acetyl-D-galactosamine dehydrogenase
MHARTIAVIGLGYVGLPVAVAFGRLGPTIGFDIDSQRIRELSNGYDRTRECTDSDLAKTDIDYTDDSASLSSADFYIVTVPTPIDAAKNPDLGPLESASRLIGPQLKQGDIVVYESTVYPGVTEHSCIPWLEEASGLACGEDFSVGYSPERINPGDHVHRLEHITKIVSGLDAATLETVAAVYESIIDAGVHRAPSIKVAEAAKVIENTQRDLNIALMNELAIIFDRLDIDTNDVLAAAGTKWNFLPFTPGLVGGHCIGVDPYYLTHKAALLGYHPHVILAGRRVNDGMGEFIVRQTIKRLLRLGLAPQETLVTILGLTFKENVPDLRNTRVVDIVRELRDFGIPVQITDPLAEPDAVAREFGQAVTPLDKIRPASCVILAVAHQQYVTQGWPLVSSLLDRPNGVVIDVRSTLPIDAAPNEISLWRL